MSDIIPISQLPPLTISQAANLDVLPITHDSDIVTYKISLQTLDAFIKTSPSSSKYFSGSIDCAVIATSSLSSSYLTYTGTNNGTSSYSMQSLTSSYSVSSSYVSTSSYANIAAFALSTTQTSINTASLAYTASFLYYNQSGVIPNGTASYAVSGGFAKSSSYSNNSTSSSYALSSSYSNNSTTSSYAKSSSISPVATTKAWCQFMGNISSSNTAFNNNEKGNCKIISSYNISNVFRQSTGLYDVFFSSPSPFSSNNSYMMNANGIQSNPQAGTLNVVEFWVDGTTTAASTAQIKSTDSIRIWSHDTDIGNRGYSDGIISLAFHGY
jgi:hypothetical protein